MKTPITDGFLYDLGSPTSPASKSDYVRGFIAGARSFRGLECDESPLEQQTAEYIEGRIDGYNWAYFTLSQTGQFSGTQLFLGITTYCARRAR